MLLIVILNAVLAIGIIGVMVALHAKAIVADRPSTLGTLGEPTVRPEPQPRGPEPARRPVAAQRQQVAPVGS